MVPKKSAHSDLAIPPGEYLEEVIAELNMSKDELARDMGRTASTLGDVFAGTEAITDGTALHLEKVTGVPAHIWLGLEAEYRHGLARKRGTVKFLERPDGPRPGR